MSCVCMYVCVCSQPYFQELIQFMASGPSHVLVISIPEGTDDVISAWQAFLGPADIEEAKREQPERYALHKPHHKDYEKSYVASFFNT